MSDIAVKFLLANLAAACAIAVVIVLRKPARTAFGARLAYGLWLIVPLAAVGSLLPPRIVEIVQTAHSSVLHSVSDASIVAQPFETNFAAELPLPPQPSPTTIARPSIAIAPLQIATWLWLAGAVAMFAWQMRNQSRFMADARAGFAGPAVAGFLRPRIVTPSDFKDRFDRDERQVIIAHETIHLSRNDARINALVALARCFCWFNPLVHVAGHLMRIDQELACDATVVERYPKARAVYANALLKAQLAARPLPLGCYWPAGADHPLTERIEMLKQAKPSRIRRTAGASGLALLALGACAGAWAALPAETHIVVDASAMPQPVDAATRAPAPSDAASRTREPSPVLAANDEPAPPEPAQLQPPETANAEFDPNDPIHLLGKVEKIEFGESAYVAFIRARTIASCPQGPSEADTRLWELAPTPYWGDRDAITRDLADKDVYARGFNARDKSCAPNCRMLARAVFKSTGYYSGFSDPALTCSRDGPQQPIRYAPQQAPQQPVTIQNASLTLPADMPIYLRGKVESIDFRETSYVVFLRATSISFDLQAALLNSYDWRTNGQVIPNSALWELSAINFFGDRENIRADLMGKNVEVRGTNLNSDCTPACRIKAQDFIMPRSSEVPPPTAGASQVAEFALRYDTTRPAVVRGKVERIEFHDGMFDAWIRSASYGPLQDRLHQVRSEYRFPRAEIERVLLNQTVTAIGWRARENVNTHCDPVCGVYATEFELPNKARVLPASERLVSDPVPDAPAAFREVFDWTAPITIEGKITKVENGGSISGPGDRSLANVVWVEAANVTPASTPGATVGTVWRIVGGGLPAPVESQIGRKVTAYGYNAKDKSCQPTCMMAHVEMSVAN